MSCFNCDICHNPKDADYDGCYEHPDDECMCICEACYYEFPEPDLDEEVEE